MEHTQAAHVRWRSLERGARRQRRLPESLAERRELVRKHRLLLLLLHGLRRREVERALLRLLTLLRILPGHVSHEVVGDVTQGAEDATKPAMRAGVGLRRRRRRRRSARGRDDILDHGAERNEWRSLRRRDMLDLQVHAEEARVRPFEDVRRGEGPLHVAGRVTVQPLLALLLGRERLRRGLLRRRLPGHSVGRRLSEAEGTLLWLPRLLLARRHSLRRRAPRSAEQHRVLRVLEARVVHAGPSLLERAVKRR